MKVTIMMKSCESSNVRYLRSITVAIFMFLIPSLLPGESGNNFAYKFIAQSSGTKSISG